MYILFSCTVTQIPKWVSLEGITGYCLVLLREGLLQHSTQDCVQSTSEFPREADNICVKTGNTTWYCCIFCVSLVSGWFLKNSLCLFRTFCFDFVIFNSILSAFLWKVLSAIFHKIFSAVFSFVFHSFCIVCQYLLRRSVFLPYSVFRFWTSIYLNEKPLRVYMRQ